MTTRAKVSAACATVVLAVAGLATAYDREPPDLGMTIDEVRTEWPPVVGGNVPTFVTLTNRTPRPVRLLGNHVMACGNNVCYAAKFLSPKTLAPGESVIANPGALTFAFTGVTDDSRCPTNALIQCVWAGSARVSLRVTGRNGSRDVTIETMPLRDTVTVDRFLVRLVTVAPAKLTTAPIPAASYRATLRVTTK